MSSKLGKVTPQDIGQMQLTVEKAKRLQDKK